MRRRLQRRGWIPAFQRSSRLPDWTAGALRLRMETPQWPLANRQQSRRLELGQRQRSDSLERPCSTGDGLRFIHSSSSCGRIGFNVLSVLLHTKQEHVELLLREARQFNPFNYPAWQRYLDIKAKTPATGENSPYSGNWLKRCPMSTISFGTRRKAC